MSGCLATRDISHGQSATKVIRGKLDSVNCLLFIQLLRLEMRRLMSLLALLTLLVTLKLAERVQPKLDVVSHPSAVPVVILIQYEFLKITPFSYC